MTACLPLALALALLAGTPAPPQADPVAAGLHLLSEGRAEEAERLLAGAVHARPSDGPAWNALGLARHSLARWETAAYAFSRAASLMPKEARVHANLGAALFEKGDLSPARVELQAAVKLDAAYAKPHLLLGRVCLAEGDLEGAEAALREATRLDPKEPVAWYHLGLLQLQARRPDEAVTALKQCLQLSPDMPSAHLNLGLALRRTGDEAGSKTHLERFRELSEAIARDAQQQARLAGELQQARRALEDGRPEAALRHASEARDLAPQSPAPHALLAEALARLGRSSEAEAARRRSEQLAAPAGAKR